MSGLTLTWVVTVVGEPTLRVEEIEGHPGRRRLVVGYDLDLDLDEFPAPGEDLEETVVVRARDLHDAPVRPRPLEIVLDPVTDLDPAQRARRVFEREVSRVDLDVEQDWWRAGQGGEVEPLSEFVDHLYGVITIRLGADIVAEAETPIVTGSWGPLGGD